MPSPHRRGRSLQSSASRTKPLVLPLLAAILCSQLLLVVEDSANKHAFSGLNVVHRTPRASSAIGCKSKNYWGDDPKTVEEVGERTTSEEIVKGYIAGSALGLTTLLFGALAVGGEYIPAPVGLAIVASALAFAVYASLNGATRRSGEKVDWMAEEDRKDSVELLFSWPWLKKGEKPSKGGINGFF